MTISWRSPWSAVLALVMLLGVLSAGPGSVPPPAEAAVRTVFSEGDYQCEVLADGTAQIVWYTGKDAELTVPAVLGGYQVTGIGAEAFWKCSDLTSVTIPEGVIRIGDRAFYECGGLTSVTIPDSVKDLGYNPFYGCESLSSVTVSQEHGTLATIDGVLFSKPDRRLICFPPGLKKTKYAIPQGIAVIGGGAFYYCRSLKEVAIPDSVITLGDDAFSCCHGLTKITIPDSVKNVGANPFLNCTALASVTVSPDHETLVMQDGVLFSRPDRRLVSYPQQLTADEYAIPEETLVIGDGAFFNNRKLTGVTIPDSVTRIGDWAFAECDFITQITIPEGVTDIGNWAFYYCKGLSAVTIPEGVTGIGDMAFLECSSLKAVTIPDSVTRIGVDAFMSCSEELVITVPRDSCALEYCRENGIAYVYDDAYDWLNGN